MLGAAALAAEVEAPAKADEMAAFFPKPQEISGWVMDGDIQTYAGNKIFDFIDGAGEVFMKYNFVVVSAAEYKGPGDAAMSVRVYKMKTCEDAYGIYAYHRPAKAELLKVPQAGFASGITAGLWRDVYYVEIQGIEDKPGVGAAVKEFVSVMAARIPGEGNLPMLFKVIQVDGFQPDSIRFVRSNLALKNLHFVSNDDILKLDEGALLVFADFVLKGRSFKAFAILYPTQAAAEQSAAAWAKALGANPQGEATWFKQSGKAIVGVWAGIKAADTKQIESMMYDTIENILFQFHTYQLNT